MDISKITVKDMVMDERKALHDICNQLVVTQGMASFLKRSFSKGEIDFEKESARLEKLLASVEKITKIATDRREILYQLSDDK